MPLTGTAPVEASANLGGFHNTLARFSSRLLGPSFPHSPDTRSRNCLHGSDPRPTPRPKQSLGHQWSCPPISQSTSPDSQNQWGFPAPLRTSATFVPHPLTKPQRDAALGLNPAETPAELIRCSRFGVGISTTRPCFLAVRAIGLTLEDNEVPQFHRS